MQADMIKPVYIRNSDILIGNDPVTDYEIPESANASFKRPWTGENRRQYPWKQNKTISWRFRLPIVTAFESNPFFSRYKLSLRVSSENHN